MTSGDEHSSPIGRIAAIATLAVSVALFATALLGISAIDPNADAAVPATPAVTHSISLDGQRDRDCPWRSSSDAARSGVRS
jgi:hypothetical protein